MSFRWLWEHVVKQTLDDYIPGYCIDFFMLREDNPGRAILQVVHRVADAQIDIYRRCADGCVVPQCDGCGGTT